MSKSELQKLFRGHETEVLLDDNTVILLHEEVSLEVQERCAALELVGVEISYLWE